MSFALNLGDPVSEQLDHLVAVNLSRLWGVELILRSIVNISSINSNVLHIRHRESHTYIEIA